MSLIIIPLNDNLYPVRHFLTPELVKYIEKQPIFIDFIKEITHDEQYTKFIKLPYKQQLDIVKSYLSLPLLKQLNKNRSSKKQFIRS